ncbi:MAG TPA: chloride channel protein [Phycisphaerae bacterium]|nr:chloride channel protein [Phycisphaerae bacterium]
MPSETDKSSRLPLGVRIVHVFRSLGFPEDWFLVVLAVAIGATTGLGAVGFYELIKWVTRLCYGPEHGLYHGYLVMLVVLPAAGALLVGLLTQWFASEAKGHGVPEVMDAIYRQGGRIRPRVAAAKALASALTIGSGGSAGTEGPIIQIGSALGSTFGQLFKLTPRQLTLLVACGAGAGISAIFDAPIAGVLFALEIFLGELSFRAFSPVVLASVLSNSVARALIPERANLGGAIFYISVDDQAKYQFVWTELPYYAVLGGICALVAVAFIKALYGTEDLFDWFAMPAWAKPVLGAAGLGLIGVVAVWWGGERSMPSFYGNGYPLITQAIDPEYVAHFSIGLLLGLGALKLVATCLTLGSGGSGGVFAPSLFMGATVGGAFGLLLNRLGLLGLEGANPGLYVGAYALVGMAAVVAATTHAPLTGIVILFELTRDYRVILPVMFAAILATAGAQLLARDSIYTLKLRRRGIRLSKGVDMSILRSMTAADLPRQKPVFVSPEQPLQDLLDIAQESDVIDFVVADEHQQYQGMVLADEVRVALLQPEAVPLLLVEELVRKEAPVIYPHETLDVVLDKFARCDADALPLAAGRVDERIVGLITRHGLFNAYHAEFARRAST